MDERKLIPVKRMEEAMADLTFEQVKPLIEQMIEQMSSTEVERLRVWLNSPETVQPTPESTAQRGLSWGESLVALVREFDLDATGPGWDNEDPETWVRKHRRAETARRNPDWGEE